MECELPLDGSRFTGWLPPVVNPSAFVIRKHAHLIHTFADYVRDGIIREQQTDTLRRTGGCPESGHDLQPCGDLTVEPLPA